MNMNEIMSLALLVMLAAIIAGIGYACYKVGYSKGNREGMDMQKLLSKAFEKDEPTDERDSTLRDRAESQSKRQEARGGEPVLVEVAIPLECIEIIRCDFDGIYHVQVFGKDVVTDKETYQRVVEARDAYLLRMRELGVEVDE